MNGATGDMRRRAGEGDERADASDAQSRPPALASDAAAVRREHGAGDGEARSVRPDSQRVHSRPRPPPLPGAEECAGKEHGGRSASERTDAATDARTPSRGIIRDNARFSASPSVDKDRTDARAKSVRDNSAFISPRSHADARTPRACVLTAPRHDSGALDSPRRQVIFQADLRSTSSPRCDSGAVDSPRRHIHLQIELLAKMTTLDSLHAAESPREAKSSHLEPLASQPAARQRRAVDSPRRQVSFSPELSSASAPGSAGVTANAQHRSKSSRAVESANISPSRDNRALNSPSRQASMRAEQSASPVVHRGSGISEDQSLIRKASASSEKNHNVELSSPRRREQLDMTRFRPVGQLHSPLPVESRKESSAEGIPRALSPLSTLRISAREQDSSASTTASSSPFETGSNSSGDDLAGTVSFKSAVTRCITSENECHDAKSQEFFSFPERPFPEVAVLSTDEEKGRRTLQDSGGPSPGRLPSQPGGREMSSSTSVSTLDVEFVAQEDFDPGGHGDDSEALEMRNWFTWESSLFIFAPHNRLRKFLMKVTRHWAFEPFIFLNILVNCVFLALEDPTGVYKAQDWLRKADYYFTGLFTLEVVIKVIAYGFILNPRSRACWKMYGRAYLRDPWNWIDFVVVVMAYPGLFEQDAQLNAFRALRALRPLRTIKIIPTLRYTVQGLISAIPLLLDVLLQAFFVLYLFAVLGLMLFEGVLRKHCTDGTSLYVDFENPDGIICGHAECPIDVFTCETLMCATMTANGAMTFPNPNFGYTNFDNILYGLLTDFQCITLAGWAEVMYLFMDATTTWAALYFVVLVFVGAFLVTNLAIAVLTETYTSAANEEDQNSVLQSMRTGLISLHRSVLVSNSVLRRPFPRRGQSDETGSLHEDRMKLSLMWTKVVDAYRRFVKAFSVLNASRNWLLFYIVETTWFEALIMLVVVANTAILAAQYAFMPQSLMDAFGACNLAFTVVFVVEGCIKIYAFGPVRYFIDPANLLDFVIIVVAIVEFVVPADFQGLTVFRALRLLRIFKLVRAFEQMSVLIRLMGASFASILRFSPVLLLFIFIFVIMGMQFFGSQFLSDAGTVCTPSSTEDEGCPRANWSNFGNAFLVVFQVLTGENWNEAMWNAMQYTSPWAALFFVFMFVVLTYVMLNIFLTIVLFDFNVDASTPVETMKGQRGTDGASASRMLSKRVSTMSHRFFTTLKRAVLVEWNRCAMCWTCSPAEQVLRSDSSENEMSDFDGHSDSDLDHRIGGPVAVRGGASSRAPMESSSFGNALNANLMVDDSANDGQGKKVEEEEKQLPQRGLQEPPNEHHPASKFGSLCVSDRDSRTSHASGQEVENKFDHVREASGHVGEDKNARPRKPPVLLSIGGEIDEMDGTVGSRWRENGDENRLSSRLKDAESKGIRTSTEFVPADSYSEDHEEIFQDELLVGSSIDNQGLGRCAFFGPRSCLSRRAGYSLWLFAPTSRVRLFCQTVAESVYFEYFIIVIIIWSCINLAIYSPGLDPDGTTARALKVMDYLFVSVFTLEMIIKIIAMNFVLARVSYLRDPWNILDFVIVITGILDLALSTTDLSFFRALRALRVLRILRLVRRFDGLKLVVQALALSFIPCINVILVALVIWLVFAILGVQLFAGKFYSCQCPESMNPDICSDVTAAVAMGIAFRQGPVSGMTECDPSTITGNTAPEQCLAMGGTWTNFPSNFDNTGIALLTLFEVASLSNWLDIMYAAMDATGENMQPVEDNQFAACIYFVAFIFVGSFFLISILVSVILDAFVSIRSKKDGTALLTPEQREWIESCRMMFQLSVHPIPLAPNSTSCMAPLRIACFRMVTQTWFEITVMSLIVLNSITLGMEFYGANAAWEWFYFISGAVFTWLFVLEMILKLLGLGVRQYFRDRWNLFDFVIVLLSLVTFVLDVIALSISNFNSPFDATVLRVFRVFRLLRVLRLTKRFKNLRLLVETLMLSLPSLVNVGSLMALVFYIYAVIGVQFFGTVQPLDNPPPTGGGINAYANFTTFYWAVLTLLQCATADTWNGIMWDLVSLGGWYKLAVLYFVTFIFLGAYVLINIFIAIMIEAFASVIKRDEFKINETHLERYAEVWSRYDPNAERKILVRRDLKPFLMELEPPLGIGAEVSTRELFAFIDSLNLPDSDGKVEFHGLLKALAFRAYGAGEDLAVLEVSQAGTSMTKLEKAITPRRAKAEPTWYDPTDKDERRDSGGFRRLHSQGRSPSVRSPSVKSPPTLSPTLRSMKSFGSPRDSGVARSPAGLGAIMEQLSGGLTNERRVSRTDTAHAPEQRKAQLFLAAAALQRAARIYLTELEKEQSLPSVSDDDAPQSMEATSAPAGKVQQDVPRSSLPSSSSRAALNLDETEATGPSPQDWITQSRVDLAERDMAILRNVFAADKSAEAAASREEERTGVSPPGVAPSKHTSQPLDIKHFIAQKRKQRK
ncbi:Sodium channel protein type 10 subunit alpha [Porphyridium purpureum]|uniref:Sodium channel protein type 10 subunit alpha n=1 Tax=Porphyridium purpureum TaxID=35688 RepID=A0A5J4YU76_PORPP|nr:Sodium channel protein type 10 subunit alpha [Porphyridium purpureum]|eukprot:POR1848..scf227_4